MALLFILTGGGLLLQRLGLIYVGPLAELVGGLPRSPAKALAVISNRATALDSYSYEAAVAATFHSSLPEITEDTAALVPEASGTIKGQRDATTLAGNFNFTLVAGYPTAVLEGKAVVAADRATVLIDTLSFFESQNNWRTLTRADFDQSAFALPLLSTDLLPLLAGASGGRYIGPSTLADGQATLVYEFDLAPWQQPADASIKDGRLSLWVNKKDGRILVAQADWLLATAAGDLLVQVQTSLSEHGAATVEGLPTDAVTEKATVAQLLAAVTGQGEGEQNETTVATGDTGGGGDQTDQTDTGTTTPAQGNAKDAQRTKDLQTIAAALGEYKNNFGLYPISRDLLKSTTAGNALESALTPEYLEKLPVDPDGSKYYYGYRSDGFSYTLTSILEDGSVEGAKRGANIYYQEITGS